MPRAPRAAFSLKKRTPHKVYIRRTQRGGDLEAHLLGVWSLITKHSMFHALSVA
jgi:hypothetical protein